MTDRDALATSAAIGGILAFGASAALVGFRGHLQPEIVVLLLALVVVAMGRLTTRAGAISAALMAAASYDFFFTRPYLSLKIDSSRDLGVTAVLFAVGIVAGGFSSRARRDHRLAVSNEMDNDTIRRLLDVAGERSVEDVEMAVRAELLKLLELSDCEFTRDTVSLPSLGPTGALPRAPLIHRRDGFQLPQPAFAIAVTAAGQRLGSLVCTPVPGTGIGIARRRTAVAAAHILGLVLIANPDSPQRKAVNG